MLEYCGMSYKNIQPEEGFELKFINDKYTDVQCFLRIIDESMIITFRGSDSLKDWVVDSKFLKSVVPYNNYSSKIRVHSGFISTYKSENVRGKIHREIKKNRINKVTITGHSYGAALAILCAVDLEYNFPKNDYEVIHQLRINTRNSFQRYDVILLINGLPVVQIELKTLDVSPRRAMQQIVDYKNDVGNGYTNSLLCFMQMFIVSNQHNTYYFANNNKEHFNFNAEEKYLPVYQWADEKNQKITGLEAFQMLFYRSAVWAR